MRRNRLWNLGLFSTEFFFESQKILQKSSKFEWLRAFLWVCFETSLLISSNHFLSMSSLNCVRANRKFSAEEDLKLQNIVNKLGTHSWKSVASFMPGRNVRQCRERWNKFLSPSVNKAPFTSDEDRRLLSLYKELGPQWVKIGKTLGNRSDISIKARFMLLERHRKKKGEKKTTQQKKVKEIQAVEKSDPIDELFAFENIFDVEDFFEFAW